MSVMLIYLSVFFCIFMKCSNAIDNGYGSRQELVIHNVSSYDQFKLGRDVLKWQSVSLREKNYAVGLMHNGLSIIVAERNGAEIITVEKVTDLKGVLLDMKLFKMWNMRSRKYDVFVVVSVERNQCELEWYKIKEDNNLELIWTWHVHKHVSHINIFEIENKQILLAANVNIENRTAIDVYEFSLMGGRNEFWLIQTIPLEIPTKHSALNNYGPDYFLSIPQISSLRVFKYTNDRFTTFKNYTTESISFVSSFKLGYKSFIVTDGYHAGIYQFTKSGIAVQTIERGNLDMVNYWLPISITTYRDEIILLAQRTLDHTSHKSFAIEVILFRGENFVVHEEMLCSYYGEVSSGMNCIVEDDTNENGIFGSTVLTFGSYLGLLVPKSNSSSGLFIMKIDMKELPNPKKLMMDNLRARRIKLEGMIENRKIMLQKIEERIANSVKLDVENNITAPWRIKTMVAPLKAGNDTLDGIVSERSPSSGSDLEHFGQQIAKIGETIKEMQTKLLGAVPLSDGNRKFEKLIVNGSIEVLGKSNVQFVKSEKFNDDSTDFVFNDCVRLDNISAIPSQKSFTNLDVQDVEFESVNGVNATNLIFQNNSSPVTIKGILMFDKTVEVLQDFDSTTGNVNDMNLKEEVVEVGKSYLGEFTFEQLKVPGTLEVNFANKFPIHSNYLDGVENENDTNVGGVEFQSFYVPGNVTVGNVNGVNFNEFLGRLCLRNIRSYIPGDTFITKDVKISGNLDINYLNNWLYPDQFVFANSESFTKIHGNKVFKKSVTAKEITIDGLINGIETSTIITLSEDQTIPGIFVFTDLELTERLDVDGNVTGSNVEDFLPNFTIKDTNVIKSNINFHALEVEGEITVGDHFNGSDIRHILGNIVFKDENSVVINSVKEFEAGITVRNGIEVLSNSINDIQLEKFIDKISDQDISIQILNGDVVFENLNLKGLYDGTNVTKLYEETVKLNGDQRVSGTLTFENEVLVEDLEITGELNELKPDEYVYVIGDRTFMALANLRSIKAESMTVEGNFYGDIENFDIDDFENKMFSLTKDQYIKAEYSLNNATIRNVVVEKINDYPYNQLFGLDRFIDIIRGMFNDNKLQVKDLTVNGNLTIEFLNNLKMEDITKNCVYRNDKLNSNISFSDTVYFKSIEVGEFNGVNIDEFAGNLIYRNETDLTIKGQKVFTDGIEVDNFIETRTINYIPLEHVLRKSGNRTVAGPLSILGDVVIHADAEISKNFNEVPMKNLTDLFEIVNGTYIINGDMFFEKMAYINTAIINGFVNGNNLTDFFDHVVHLGDDVIIPSHTTFTNTVRVNGNLAITDNINGIDLSKFKHDVVLITQDAHVEGFVTFVKPVIIEEQLNLDYHFLSRYVMGVDLQNWIDNVVYINRGIIPGALSFKSVTIYDDVETPYINNVNMSTLIPLRTEQTIDHGLYIEELTSFHDIVVDNLVNNIKLDPSYLNTVMNNGDQHITSSIVFKNNVVVHETAQLNHLNAIDFNKIVTTYTNQNLSAVYHFNKEVTMDADLSVYGLVSGVNLTQWNENGLHKFAEHPQNIINDWVLNNNLTFGGNVRGDVLISGMDMKTIADHVETKRQFKLAVENRLVEDYKKVCTDVDYFLNTAKTQVYRFKYLEHVQLINFEDGVQSIHQFSHQGIHYLLVNEENSCKSSLLSWSNSQFSLITQIETGSVSQFITVRDGENIYIVGTSRLEATDCNIEGSNIWKFEDDINLLLHIGKIETQLILQDSLIPGTFYGLEKDSVTEFKITSSQETPIRKYRKWKIQGKDLAFIPRGLTIGLALRDGNRIYKLHRDDQVMEFDLGYEVETIINGVVTEGENIFFPSRNMGDAIVLRVGRSRNKTMVAVAVHEETSVKGRLDFIKIYDNILMGKLYHKVSTYKPSSLVAMEFGNNGQSFLVFLEDQRTLQIYEYKGVEGFKLRSFAKINGQKLVPMTLPTDTYQKERTVIAVIDRTKLSLLGAVMDGDEVNAEKSDCEL